MSGVKEVLRWQLKGFIPGVEGVSKAVLKPWVVLASDFDALAQQLALSKEEVSKLTWAKQTDEGAYSAVVKQNSELSQQLAARDKQLADAVGLLREWGDMFQGGLAASALGKLRIKNAAFLSLAEGKAND